MTPTGRRRARSCRACGQRTRQNLPAPLRKKTINLNAVFFGVAVNVAHILIIGGVGSDDTGILFTIAGSDLLGLAFHIGFRGRRRLVQALWTVPDAGHVEALNTHSQDYTARVTARLKAALFHRR